MAGRLDGKIALVTGAASGIGRACAQRLAEEGAVVFVTDLQPAPGEAAAAAIRAGGGRATFIAHDVTDEDAWVQVIEQVRAAHGRLDILVNNAGIALGGPVLAMSLADWRRQIAVNLDGVFLGVKHGVPLMRQSGEGGAIVNLSSVAGLRASPGLAGYSATKGGVLLFTKSVARECADARDGIRVNSVHPGVIDTPIWSSVRPGDNAFNLDAMASALVPTGVKGSPTDIAEGVLWLCSPESRYVTGAELVIDGGLLLR